MKGKLICIIVGLSMISSVSFASPLMDYSKGKTSVDINFYPSIDSHLTNTSGYDQSPKGKSDNFEWGLTTGLGNNFAVQFRQFNPETKTFDNGSIDESVKVLTKEFNVLYSLNKNLSVFVGYQWAKLQDNIPDYSISTSKNRTQFGLNASTSIDPQTNLFGIVGVGNDLTNYEIGISHNIAPQLELNVSYRDLHIKNVPGDDTKRSAEYKGMGYGVIYKF